jgi:radical SAM superfamily enzyme YgiQ (UPF0313 family)
MLRLKALARRTRGKIVVFFVDDNFAISAERTKSLLRDIIGAGAQLAWVAQVSANLLRDEELVDLMAESGAKWVFIGMESLDPQSLSSVKKSFSKPGEYAGVLERLARRNIYAITAFILGLDNDTPGVAERTLGQIRDWPAGLPVFGQITPYPATPLYARLQKEGRLTRPKHWLEFSPFRMAHTPLKMTIPEVEDEIRKAWTDSYTPEATRRALDWMRHEPVPYQISHLIARLFFRGIYFPQKGAGAWLRLLAENRSAIVGLIKEALKGRRGAAGEAEHLVFEAGRAGAAPRAGTPLKRVSD